MSVRSALEAEDLARPPRLSREAKDVRILTIDIEWRPMLSYHWDLWDQNIGIIQIKEHGGLLCFAAKWFGTKDVMFWSERDGHDVMVREAHRLLSEADIIITYNGDKYDVRKLNGEFLLAGFPPPQPYKSIDLVKTNKTRFDLPSRKLDYLVQRTGIGAKVKHDGFELWLGCIADDDASWALMEKYNRADVTLTERAYVRLLPWLTNAPHLGMFTGDEFCCPYCGSKKLKMDDFTDFAHTLMQKYRLYECRNCGGWIRGLTKLQDPPIRTRPIR